MLAPIVLGIGQGVRHSLEPDHIAAVSTLLGDRWGARRSAWLGAIWGIGHTVSLVAMCAVVVGFGAMLPPEADRAFTLAVAAMLVVLGVRSLSGSAGLWLQRIQRLQLMTALRIVIGRCRSRSA